jgi:hypothetical protein
VTVKELIDILIKEDSQAIVTCDISPISGEDRVITTVVPEKTKDYGNRVILQWD